MSAKLDKMLETNPFSQPIHFREATLEAMGEIRGLKALNAELLEALEAFTDTFESAKPMELIADLSKVYEKCRSVKAKSQ